MSFLCETDFVPKSPDEETLKISLDMRPFFRRKKKVM
jgi:hypothetical protein